MSDTKPDDKCLVVNNEKVEEKVEGVRATKVEVHMEAAEEHLRPLKRRALVRKNSRDKK